MSGVSGIGIGTRKMENHTVPFVADGAARLDARRILRSRLGANEGTLSRPGREVRRFGVLNLLKNIGVGDGAQQLVKRFGCDVIVTESLPLDTDSPPTVGQLLGAYDAFNIISTVG